MTLWVAYLMTVSDSVRMVAGAIVGLAIIISILTGIAFADTERQETKNTAVAVWTWAAIAAAIAACILIVVPGAQHLESTVKRLNTITKETARGK